MSVEEDFLRRWARRKRQAAAGKPAKAAPKPLEGEPGELPSLDSLTFESDFTAFLKANVEESVKRAALKKLLHDPRFNVMDGLDTYIDDYSINDPIPEEMLKKLEHARSTLFGPAKESDQPKESDQASVETAEAPEHEQSAQAPEGQGKPEDDGDPRKDA